MCLVPCHEVSNLRPMGFVASFGLEQNTTLIFSFSISSSLNGKSDHLSDSHIQPALPDLQPLCSEVRGAGGWPRLPWQGGQAECGVGTGRGDVRGLAAVLSWGQESGDGGMLTNLDI